MSWSIEETIIRAQSAVAVAMQGVWDVFTHRPAYANDHPIPGCPSPSDCRGYGCAGDCSEALEAVERLSGKEAEEEVAEPAECPTGFYAGEDEWYCTGCNGFFSSQAEFAKHRYEDEVPNPTEPSLSDDELVGVRGLLQERYETSTAVQCSGSVEHPAGGLTHSPTGVPPAGPDISLPWQMADLTEHYTTLAVPGERPWGITDSWGRVIARIETQAHAEAVVAAVNTDPSRSNRLASVRGEGGAPDSGIHTSPGAPQPDDGDCFDYCVGHSDADLDWAGWSIPAVLEVLAEHRWASRIGCCSCGETDDGIRDYDWREHVAPLIASRLACDPARAIAALHNHKPQ